MTSSQDTQTKLITYADVEARTGIKLSTLYSLVRRKRIPHIRLGRRLIRFDPDAITAWLVAGSVEVSQ